MAVGSIVAQESVVRKTQFPRAGDPARGRAHEPVQPRHEPRRGVRVHPRLGHRPDVDVAAAAGRRSCCLTVFTTAVSMIVSALNPRFRDIGIIWSVAVTALFYATPGAVPAGDRARQARAAAGAQPAGAAVRARPQVGDRPVRARPGGAGRRRRPGCWSRRRCSSRSACWRRGSSTARRRGSPRSCERASSSRWSRSP